jgi:ribulose-phosphate 3-epimerase
MTTNPDAYLERFAGAGADIVTIHIEVFPDPTSVAERARRAGLRFGLVMNPPTPFAAVAPFAELTDMVLIMSVHPGFGGQEFIPEVLGKVAAAREWVDSRGLSVDIQIDGGITPVTARRAADVGANVFVAGTSIFRADDPRRAIEDLRTAIGGT